MGNAAGAGSLPSNWRLEEHQNQSKDLEARAKTLEKNLAELMDVAKRTAATERMAGIDPKRSTRLKGMRRQRETLQAKLKQVEAQREKLDELLHEVGSVKMQQGSKDLNRDLLGVLKMKDQLLQQKLDAERGVVAKTHEQEAESLRREIQGKESVIQDRQQRREGLLEIRRERLGEESGGLGGEGGEDDFLREIGAVEGRREQQGGQESEGWEGEAETRREMFFPTLPTYSTVGQQQPQPQLSPVHAQLPQALAHSRPGASR